MRVGHRSDDFRCRHARRTRPGTVQAAGRRAPGAASPVHVRIHRRRDHPCRTSRGRREFHGKAVYVATAAGTRSRDSEYVVRTFRFAVTGEPEGPHYLQPTAASYAAVSVAFSCSVLRNLLTSSTDGPVDFTVHSSSSRFLSRPVRCQDNGAFVPLNSKVVESSRTCSTAHNFSLSRFSSLSLCDRCPAVRTFSTASSGAQKG